MPRPIIVKILGLRIPQASGVIDHGAAHLDDPNVFTDVNTIPGLRVGTVTITDDYVLRVIDFEVLADATSGDIAISLPAALATGQIYRIKKIDNSANTVTLIADGMDQIDGDSSVILSNQYNDCTVVDAANEIWDKFTGGGDVTDVARLSQPNVFTNLNTLTGVQFGTQTVTDDYTLTALDYELLVNGTLDSIDITLPPATGSGQVFRVKKIDDTSSIIAVIADGGDTIDGSISINLDTQWADCTIIDAAPGYWDNTGGLEPLDPSFTDLVDVPSSYTGEALKVVRVNAAEDGLEFSASAGGAAWGDITGTLSAQTDLQTALDAKVDENGAITGATKTKVTYDTKGLVTAGADATTADISDSSNKRYVTDANLTVIGNTSGTNTGDQTSIVGITGSLAEFNTALTGADFASGGGTVTGASSGTNTGDQTTIVGITGTLAEFNTALTGADFATGGGTVTGASSGTNTGDQASIVGITGTKAQFDTAVTDGNILYVGDVTQYTDELAQDAVGGMVDTTLTYVDATPLLQRAALTGAITASAGSNATALGSFTTAQINTALSDNDIATGGGTATGTNTGDQTITLTGEVTGTGTGSFATTIADSVTVASWTLTSPTLTTPSAFTTGGTITLAENTSVALDPAGSADGKYSGLTVTAVSGYAQAFGDLVTLDKDDSRWEAVDISVAAAATGDARGIMGMVVSAGTDGNACTILLQGIIRADANFPALTIGAAVYASTAGDIVVAQPSTVDHVIRLVGYAMTADEIYFNPDPTWITHT